MRWRIIIKGDSVQQIAYCMRQMYLYSYTSKHAVPVCSFGSLRADGIGLPNWKQYGGSAGYTDDPGCSDCRKGHWWIRLPQWPGIAIHFHCILWLKQRISLSTVHVHSRMSLRKRGHGNFFGTLKSECLHCAWYSTRSEIEELIVQYILFYNFNRIHLKNGLIPYEIRSKAV